MSSEPDNEPDLDAGWDEIDSAPPVSAGTPSAEAAAGPTSLPTGELDEVDAGWELDEPEPSAGSAAGGPSPGRTPDQRLRKHRNREKKPTQAERTPVAIVKPAPSRLPSLKKMQRMLGRKSREKAAAARADREQERKQRLELERRATLEQIMARAAAQQSSEPADSRAARAKKPRRPQDEQARSKPAAVDRDAHSERKLSKAARSKSEPENAERKPAATRKEKRERRRLRRERAARRARITWLVGGTIAAIALGLVIWQMTR